MLCPVAGRDLASQNGHPQKSGGRSQFPVGLRVLVVDDDPLCLMILEKMLKHCSYQVVACQQARQALSLLREKRNDFDIVLSDVMMPDMDGFKLLELVGLEMDLPVIMMSVNGETSAVMKGITHGACDYLLKPVRIEELRNIWQHVVRKRRTELKTERSITVEEKSRTEDYEDNTSGPAADTGTETVVSPGGKAIVSKRRKDFQRLDLEEDEEGEDMDANTSKKPRVLWSVELHQQFVDAVNQLGVERAVPKKILELMDVQGLTRENVASHLQKHRLYLKRLSPGSEDPSNINNINNMIFNNNNNNSNNNNNNNNNSSSSSNNNSNSNVMNQPPSIDAAAATEGPLPSPLAGIKSTPLPSSTSPQNMLAELQATLAASIPPLPVKRSNNTGSSMPPSHQSDPAQGLTAPDRSSLLLQQLADIYHKQMAPGISQPSQPEQPGFAAMPRVLARLSRLGSESLSSSPKFTRTGSGSLRIPLQKLLLQQLVSSSGTSSPHSSSPGVSSSFPNSPFSSVQSSSGLSPMLHALSLPNLTNSPNLSSPSSTVPHSPCGPPIDAHWPAGKGTLGLFDHEQIRRLLEGNSLHSPSSQQQQQQQEPPFQDLQALLGLGNPPPPFVEEKGVRQQQPIMGDNRLGGVRCADLGSSGVVNLNPEASGEGVPVLPAASASLYNVLLASSSVAAEPKKRDVLTRSRSVDSFDMLGLTRKAVLQSSGSLPTAMATQSDIHSCSSPSDLVHVSNSHSGINVHSGNNGPTHIVGPHVITTTTTTNNNNHHHSNGNANITNAFTSNVSNLSVLNNALDSASRMNGITHVSNTTAGNASLAGEVVDPAVLERDVRLVSGKMRLGHLAPAAGPPEVPVGGEGSGAECIPSVSFSRGMIAGSPAGMFQGSVGNLHAARSGLGPGDATTSGNELLAHTLQGAVQDSDMSFEGSLLAEPGFAFPWQDAHHPAANGGAGAPFAPCMLGEGRDHRDGTVLSVSTRGGPGSTAAVRSLGARPCTTAAMDVVPPAGPSDGCRVVGGASDSGTGAMQELRPQQQQQQLSVDMEDTEGCLAEHDVVVGAAMDMKLDHASSPLREDLFSSLFLRGSPHHQHIPALPCESDDHPFNFELAPKGVLW